MSTKSNESIAQTSQLGVILSIRAFFRTLTALFGASAEYAEALEQTGKYTNTKVTGWVALQKLEDAKAIADFDKNDT